MERASDETRKNPEYPMSKTKAQDNQEKKWARGRMRMRWISNTEIAGVIAEIVQRMGYK